MAENVLTQLALNNGGNPAEQWAQWLSSFKIYLTATEVNKKEEKIQVAQLLHFAGTEIQKIYSTFQFDEDEKDKLEPVINKFNNHFTPRENLTFTRYKFITSKQGEQITLEQFITDLRKQANNCNFGNLKDDLIKLMLICGTNNGEIRHRLLQEDDADLAKAIKLASIIEQSKSQARKMDNQSEREAQVDRMVKATRSRAPDRSVSRYHRSQSKNDRKHERLWSSNRNNSQHRYKGKTDYIIKCTRCGVSHQINQCPAFKKTCGKCKKLNHFANMCKSTRIVNSLSYNDCTTDENVIYINSVATGTNINNYENQTSWSAKLKIRGKPVCFKIDTGAMVNTISITDFLNLGIPFSLIEPSRVTLKSYSGDCIPIIGQCTLRCEHNDNPYNIQFYVINHITDSLLGLRTCIQLNLISKNKESEINDSINLIQNSRETNKSEFIQAYKDVFKGIGCINPPYHIHIEPNEKPVICPIRNVPHALLSKLQETLNHLQEVNIIKKVNGPSEWVHPLVLVKKNDGSLRICLDPLHLNKIIKREHCKLLSLDEITSQLQGAKYFSKLDASQAFYQIPLDDASSELCTFGTPFGRYKFLRMPYGIKCAPEVFNERFRQIFEVENVAIYIDDIIIWGNTKQQHDMVLEKVLEIASRNNVKFNLNKCQFRIKEIKFMGHIINDSGVAVDPERVKAIEDFPEPKSKKDVQRLLGVINYVNKYIPNFSEETKPLRDLLKKEIFFNWDDHHREAFHRIKNKLKESPVLSFFDPNKPITVSVDASQNGLGACLLQDNRPVCYASKALTNSQINQPQITKELLAIWFGLSKFHNYVFARSVIVESDHKPLLALMKKPLNNAPARLQRILLSLQRYQFSLTYRPGKELIIADTLSRACPPVSQNDKELDFTDQICIVQEVNISDEYMQKVKSETLNDPELIELTQTLLKGWPNNNKSLHTMIRPYSRFKSELTVEDGIVYKNNSCVIPHTLRKNVLEKIHYSHLGYNKCIKLAEQSVFWPTMRNELKLMIDGCFVCQKYGASQPSEPLKPHEIPAVPWYRVGCDLFELNGVHYLLVVDYYSKYVELEILNHNTTSHNIINKLKNIFARFGVPQYFVSDGGPQFTSDQFKVFSKEWNFVHKITSPTHSESNGMAERHVQTLKKLVKKSIEDNKDIHLALLQLRNTPTFGTSSPSEILMSRATRNPLLPTPIIKLKSHVIDKNEYNQFLNNKQIKQSNYYNKKRGVKTLSILKPNTRVLVQLKPKSIWQPGKIVQVLGERRYKVLVDNKGTYVRNRIFLKPSLMRDNQDEHLKKKVSWSPVLDSSTKEEDKRNYDLKLGKIQLNTFKNLSKENVNDNNVESSQSRRVGDEILNYKENVNLNPNTNNYKTRSGRYLKQPKWINDYIQ